MSDSIKCPACGAIMNAEHGLIRFDARENNVTYFQCPKCPARISQEWQTVITKRIIKEERIR